MGVDVVIESTGIFRTAEKPVCTWKLDAKVTVPSQGFLSANLCMVSITKPTSQSETMSSQLLVYHET